MKNARVSHLPDVDSLNLNFLIFSFQQLQQQHVNSELAFFEIQITVKRSMETVGGKCDVLEGPGV